MSWVTAEHFKILEKEHVSSKKCIECLNLSHQRTTVSIKRDSKDVNTNNFNLDSISLWKANKGLWYVADIYCVINYVCSYVLKRENGIGEILKQVGEHLRDKDIKEKNEE